MIVPLRLRPLEALKTMHRPFPAPRFLAMDPTADDWDARVARLSGKLPDPLRRAVDGLREPLHVWLRLSAALLFILGGIFSILPVLGLWMLPLGLALLAQDVPGLKVPLEKSARGIEATWNDLVAWWRRQKR